MFKFLWKLLKMIRESDDFSVFVTRLANPREKAFCKETLETCCEQSGDVYATQYVTIIQKILSNIIAESAGDIETFLFRACDAFKAEKQLQAKPAQINSYFKQKRSRYILLMRTWHYQLAIADILLGHYEDLDPIIGDQACEMRCPFLLDIITVVLDASQSFKGKSGEGHDYLAALARAIYQQTLDYPNDNEQLLKFKTIDKLMLGHPEDFISFCTLCADLLDQIPGPSEQEFLGLGVSYSNVEYDVNGDIRLIDLNEPLCNNTKKIDWAEDQDRPKIIYSACEYLRLCKTFTRNREALIDDFGIDIDHESDLRFYDIVLKQNRYSPKNLSREISDFEKQLLAHCTTAYMKFSARDISDRISAPNMLGNIYKILNSCQATINGSGYLMNLIPVFDAFRVIVTHAAKKKHPIVVNLTRLLVLDEGDEPKFQHQANWILYYEPDDSGTFIHIPEPSLIQLKKPAIAVVASSVVNPNRLCNTTLVKDSAFINAVDPTLFLEGLLQCDIVHLLMWFAANHPTFPGSATIPVCDVPGKQIVESGGKKTPKITLPKVDWIKPKNLKTKKEDCGRDYVRRTLYIETLGAPIEDHKPDEYEFSLTTAPCSLFGIDGDHHTLDWEYDYYLHLTLALGLEIEAVKYALMDGARGGHEGDTVWKRNLATLPFTPTHMYITTAQTETQHQNKMPYEDGDIVGISIRKSTMGKKSRNFRIDYDVSKEIDDDEDEEKID